MLPRQTITRILGCIATVLLLAALGLAQYSSGGTGKSTDKKARKRSGYVAAWEDGGRRRKAAHDQGAASAR